MSLIIPCGGKSSRFPTKPKWLLTCPGGNLMVQECISGLDLTNINTIYVTVNKEHLQKYIPNIKVESLFDYTCLPIKVMVLEEFTKSQSETVYLTIKNFNIKGSIFIKDCDSFFKHQIKLENYICFIEVNEKSNVKKIYNKSFIEFNNNKEILNICEKQIISPFICVGGYSFLHSEQFIDLYEKIIKNPIIETELYISHIIAQSLLDKYIFIGEIVTDYLDWGTMEEWEDYQKQFKTLFIDLDGVLVENSGKYSTPIWGESKPIKENVDFLRNLYDSEKVQVIITTARKSSFREITIKQLRRYNIPYDQIIFDLYHSTRFLINDYAITNKYPSAISLNLPRNSTELHNILD